MLLSKIIYYLISLIFVVIIVFSLAAFVPVVSRFSFTLDEELIGILKFMNERLDLYFYEWSNWSSLDIVYLNLYPSKIRPPSNNMSSILINTSLSYFLVNATVNQSKVELNTTKKEVFVKEGLYMPFEMNYDIFRKKYYITRYSFVPGSHINEITSNSVISCYIYRGDPYTEPSVGIVCDIIKIEVPEVSTGEEELSSFDVVEVYE